ncbi:TIGR03943 family putative permease subunit [Microbacterium marinilacus]|uniref:DUF1980 domain-containing protein n=1 Tax=Microbacterium marinilacus TaxID=415209 RepID=A0ABP7BT58_9MICO|nr:TIGR03943 family protein [Microbacterium marinilacus]MBY0689174.1 TIGR03943 family protein [Microbacterium marinilacus]
MRSAWESAGTRWLGAGLAAVLAVVTLGLAVTDRLALYINPDQTWFAVGMAVLALVGAVLSFVLPAGAESDHGHDHGADGEAAVPSRAPREAGGASDGASRPRPAAVRGVTLGAVATATGGVAASAVAVAALLLPPASLSVDLAMSRDTGSPPLFAGADEVMLAAADTSEFGVGDWASVFHTATSPDAFEGTHVSLTGFVTPDEANAELLRLGRLVITHCVIDAQPASVPVVSPAWQDDLEVGGWIRVDGVVTTDASGALVVEPRDISSIPAPDDPYEY